MKSFMDLLTTTETRTLMMMWRKADLEVLLSLEIVIDTSNGNVFPFDADGNIRWEQRDHINSLDLDQYRITKFDQGIIDDTKKKLGSISKKQ